jgi:DNA-binding LacI/PurR family transcriptional regulator
MLVCTKVLPELTAALEAARVPVVGDAAAAPLHMSGNNTAIVEEGVRQLLAQGCRRIALMAWRTDTLIESFTQALKVAGLPVVPEWVRFDLLPELTGAGWEEFREIWMARSEKPDGLLVMDDILFRDAMISIREMGLSIPGQLRIVAHATRGANIVYPDSVVRLEVDPAENASILGSMMLRLLAGKSVRPSRDGAVEQRESPLTFRIVPARDVVVSAAGAARADVTEEINQTGGRRR